MNNLKHKVFENIKTTEMQKYRVVMFTYLYNNFYKDKINDREPRDEYIFAYSKQDAKERVLKKLKEYSFIKDRSYNYFHDIFEVHLV